MANHTNRDVSHNGLSAGSSSVTESFDSKPKEAFKKARSQTTSSKTAVAAPNWKWLIVFTLFGLIAVILAVFIPHQNQAQQFYFRILMALAGAGLAAIIPGFFDIELQWLRSTIRAGGAIGIFVLIYSINPPRLDAEGVDLKLDGDWDGFLVVDHNDIRGGTARINHIPGRNTFTITGNVPPHALAPQGAFQSPVVTFESNFGLITNQRVVFHYRNNANEEGVAMADYANISPDVLFFNFRDFEGTDKDGIPSGVLKFTRHK